MNIGIFEAKTQLSKLVEMAKKGEQVILTQRNKPVVKMVPIKEIERPGLDDPFFGSSLDDKAVEAIINEYRDSRY
ncbi:MAG: type II toxin-antitoxin system prevent-host-death family antitoxin [Verrucomicrobiota bacterium]